MSNKQMRLLKVPKWLSDIWMKSPPGTVVADLDLESNFLDICTDSGPGKPKSLCVERRTSPELFAFSQTREALEEGSETTIEGAIAETLHVKANVRDDGYKRMLQQRLEEAAVTSGNRSFHMSALKSLEQRPDMEVVTGSNLRPQQAAEVAFGEPPKNNEVAIAVEQALRRRPNGITLEELLEQVPSGCTFFSVREALVAMAECRKRDDTLIYISMQGGLVDDEVSFPMSQRPALDMGSQHMSSSASRLKRARRS